MAANAHNGLPRVLHHRYIKFNPCHCSTPSGKEIIDCFEILVQKTDYSWHGSDKACKVDICGQTLVPPLPKFKSLKAKSFKDS